MGRAALPMALGSPKAFSFLGNFHDCGSGGTRTPACLLGKPHGDFSKDASSRALKEWRGVR